MKTILTSILFIFTFLSTNAQADKKLIGSWQTSTEYGNHDLKFTSDTQGVYDGESFSYSLSGGNFVVDNTYYPYSFQGDVLIVTVDGVKYEFENLADKELKPERLAGNWQGKSDQGTHTLKFLSDTELEFDGERFTYILKDSTITVEYEKYLYKMEGKNLMIKWPLQEEYREFTPVEE